MEKKALELALGGHLCPRGFKKKETAWYCKSAGMLQIVELQKSSFGLQFYLNLCWVPDGMEVEGMPTPNAHKCPIRIRLTALFPEQRDEIEKVFDLET